MNNHLSNISQCEDAIGYRFNNRMLLRQALTHSSCSNTHLDSNERLEFLGDATLGLVISNMLYHLFPQMAEGELSKVKSSIVSRKTCRKVALRLGLNSFLYIGKGLDCIPDSLIANVMESVTGAIFLDGGYEEVRLFIEEKFRPEIEIFFRSLKKEISPLSINKSKGKISVLDVDHLIDSLTENYKAKLQTKVQHESSLIPIYHLLDEKGPAHCRSFKMAVQIGTKQFQAAWGNSKKEAEQHAAANAYNQLLGRTPPFGSN